MLRRTSLVTAILAVSAIHPMAAELSPKTAAAFDAYVAATERRIAAEVSRDDRFLWIDGLDETRRESAMREARAGRVAVARLRTAEGGRTLEAPGGLVHHWVGLVFVPGATVRDAVALMQDYDHHAGIFAPAVQRGRVLARDGDRLHVFLRFYMKKVVAVTIDSEHDAQFFMPDARRAYSAIRSTRVAEVTDAGSSRERQMPPGEGRGYLWRLNTYWRFAERDRGVWVQCESVTLTRDIPFGFGWLIGPFVTDIPRESLTFTLDTARKTLMARQRPADPDR